MANFSAFVVYEAKVEVWLEADTLKEARERLNSGDWDDEQPISTSNVEVVDIQTETLVED